jgi:hypothetical protein
LQTGKFICAVWTAPAHELPSRAGSSSRAPCQAGRLVKAGLIPTSPINSPLPTCVRSLRLWLWGRLARSSELCSRHRRLLRQRPRWRVFGAQMDPNVFDRVQFGEWGGWCRRDMVSGLVSTAAPCHPAPSRPIMAWVPCATARAISARWRVIVSLLAQCSTGPVVKVCPGQTAPKMSLHWWRVSRVVRGLVSHQARHGRLCLADLRAPHRGTRPPVVCPAQPQRSPLRPFRGGFLNAARALL